MRQCLCIVFIISYDNNLLKFDNPNMRNPDLAMTIPSTDIVYPPLVNTSGKKKKYSETKIVTN